MWKLGTSVDQRGRLEVVAMGEKKTEGMKLIKEARCHESWKREKSKRI